ncbi:MAG: HmuY family protein [Spirochaetales bacterium]|jgi:hypothetical protein|nr:HmuY family protein [Spirochaetales bacterium]
MKKTFLTAVLSGGLAVLLLIGACSSSSDSGGGGNEEEEVLSGSFEDLEFLYTSQPNIKYFSLSLGREITSQEIASTKWDIAIEAKANTFCYIYTNSGVSATAAGSGGQGGVWFTDSTDFDDVVFSDRVTDFSTVNAEYEDYVTDVTRFQKGMSGAAEGPMNIMTYFGYAGGDGLAAETMFDWSSPGPPMSPFFEFNKHAFSTCPGGMPPPWDETGEVYIIRHGNGQMYSKFQVNSLSFASSTYHLSFRFERVNG